MDDRKIFILDDDDYDPGTNFDVKGIGEILDLSSDDDVLSAKVIGNVFNRGGPEDVEIRNRPLKREAIDLTINDDRAPLNNIFTSRNSDDALADSTTAVDVTHLFDFSSANFMPGLAYMEDEGSDVTNWSLPGIFRSPLHSPLPQTPTLTENLLRPRPSPSGHNTLSYADPPKVKRSKRANKENHGSGEENPGWRQAYLKLLKKYTCLQRERDMLKESHERVRMEKRVEGGEGSSRSPSQILGWCMEAELPGFWKVAFEKES
ncbi:uncharacterized protein BT62DRAFT_921327 [Guyanagaster necrorhizus]|uniref:Uncharacterized protein n=1 Tax=Guyanagaster necrorhizus TaxID=856835 RepID=A0A9P7VRD4_9AGAR|nr:uncharacterized protein BT62DRAFT_921327 [Guyanagaster necrorhizus MCA 3950]KAG7444554.1 hypothetical protein BT62DRAFT_921327 [Guyanagaster necrorhizus MCA 3950]